VHAEHAAAVALGNELGDATNATRGPRRRAAIAAANAPPPDPTIARS
jgi:hypothetical protein